MIIYAGQANSCMMRKTLWFGGSVRRLQAARWKRVFDVRTCGGVRGPGR
jgi:hypothetical protein